MKKASGLYRRTWKDKAGKAHQSPTWWGRYKDAKGNWQRVALFRDGVASLAELVRLQTNAEKEAANILPGNLDELQQHANRPIAEHVTAYITALKIDNRDADHIRIAEWTLNKLIAMGVWKVVGDISITSMRAILASLTGQKKTVSYRNKFISRAKAFDNWLAKDGRIQSRKLEGLKKVSEEDAEKKRARRPLEAGEVVALLNAAPPPRAAVYRFLVFTGLRRGELRQLRWSDLRLNAESPFIYLRPEITKNRKAGQIPLHPDLLAWVKEQPDSTGDGFIFASVPDVATLKKDLASAGIPFVDASGRRVDIHALRHTFCTLLALSGATMKAAQTLMRHSDPKLTANVYSQVAADVNTAAISRLKLHSEPQQITVLKMSQNGDSARRDRVRHNRNLTSASGVSTLPTTRPSTQVD